MIYVLNNSKGKFTVRLQLWLQWKVVTLDCPLI